MVNETSCMNEKKIIDVLKKRYPGKKIVKNNEDKPTEIICEIDPTEDHPDYSVAIAVIDKSVPHYHRATTEEYEVLKGKLMILMKGKKTVLQEGYKLLIKPGVVHSATGEETWIKVYAKPGWKTEDHILV